MIVLYDWRLFHYSLQIYVDGREEKREEVLTVCSFMKIFLPNKYFTSRKSWVFLTKSLKKNENNKNSMKSLLKCAANGITLTCKWIKDFEKNSSHKLS